MDLVVHLLFDMKLVVILCRKVKQQTQRVIPSLPRDLRTLKDDKQLYKSQFIGMMKYVG